MYTSKFVVEGRGHFPIDMLRYDACWPRTQEDVTALNDYWSEKPRRVVLSSAHKLKGYRPTSTRWSSFGWTVVEISKPERVQ